MRFEGHWSQIEDLMAATLQHIAAEYASTFWLKTSPADR